MKKSMILELAFGDESYTEKIKLAKTKNTTKTTKNYTVYAKSFARICPKGRSGRL